MKTKKINRVNSSFEDVGFNIDDTLIDVNLPEIDDVSPDQFGVPISKMYRTYEPNFEKAEREGRKAFKELCSRRGYHPKYVR